MDTELLLRQYFRDIHHLYLVTQAFRVDRIGEHGQTIRAGGSDNLCPGIQGFLYAPVVHPGFGIGLEPFLRVLGWGTITSIMYVPLVLIMINGRDLAHRFLGLPIFRRVATLGYGIYLVHIPVCIPLVPLARFAIYDLHLSTTLVWALILALLVFGSIAVSYVLHLIVERPMLALRDRVAPSDRK